MGSVVVIMWRVKRLLLIVNAQADALNSTLAGLAKSPKSEISTDNYQLS